MQSPNRPTVVDASNLSMPVTIDGLIEAFVNRVPAEHRPILRERLLRSDRVISAQSSDVEGQAILDRLYQLRRREETHRS